MDYTCKHCRNVCIHYLYWIKTIKNVIKSMLLTIQFCNNWYNVTCGFCVHVSLLFIYNNNEHITMFSCFSPRLKRSVGGLWCVGRYNCKYRDLFIAAGLLAWHNIYIYIYIYIYIHTFWMFTIGKLWKLCYGYCCSGSSVVYITVPWPAW